MPTAIWKVLTRLKGHVRIPVTLQMQDQLHISTPGQMIFDRVVVAFSVVCENHYGRRFAGFADLTDLAICHPNSEELRTVQDSIDARPPCLQALIASNHFLLSHKEPGDDFVRVYSSTVGPLSDHAKLQLSLIYGREIRDVRVRFSIAHRQPAGSNFCGPLVCAFMSEILDGRSPENIVYCKEEQQRQ